MAKKDHIFRINIDANNKFTYDPAEDWNYKNKDTVRFVCATNKFRVRYRAVDVADPKVELNPAPEISPFGKVDGSLRLTLDSDKDTVSIGNPPEQLFATDAEPVNPVGIDEQTIAALVAEHAALGLQFERSIQRFRYEIEVESDGGDTLTDFDKNGMWVTC